MIRSLASLQMGKKREGGLRYGTYVVLYAKGGMVAILPTTVDGSGHV